MDSPSLLSFRRKPWQVQVLVLVSSIKLVAEIALMALLGQWLLGLLAGAKRDGNLFYQLLQVVSKPFTLLVRRITPKRVADQHVPLVTFFLLLIAYAVVTLERIALCVQTGVEACK